ncbi:F-box domain [Arabidopsis thaliana x Arabidopsis arenosa]|uniref:F-box domain n=1 Tax=Arabidopsis thaliana x Arabidopsis arenosa TaxID=1240361 RepID=A0A8T1YZF0_9BRAS|nr:F-box domain [Arabidopsis thaliana x Arabidopsis arenosa]
MDTRKVKSGSREAINYFPDEILAMILFYLPTKRAVSTSLISKRWRNLFALMIQLFESQYHFYLDDSDFVYPEEGKNERKDVQESFGDFVDKTLTGCSSITKLSLICLLKCCPHTDTDRWLHHAMERGVVDLDLRFKMGITPWQYDWPSNVFTIKTLVKLTLRIDVGPNAMSYCPKVVLPVLKSLFLHAVWYTCHRLCYSMLPGCPILEELSLHHLRGNRDANNPPFSISHKNLKRLTVHFNNSFEVGRLTQFDTPSLLYLEYSGFAPCPYSRTSCLNSLVEAKIDVHIKHGCYAHMHLATVIDWICNVKTLSLSPASVKSMYSRCVELPVFSNLVKVYFESNTKEGWEVLPRLLNKSPKLETLVLKGLHCASEHGVCIDRNEVKVLEIYGFSGRGREVRQVKCLLREMQFLQVMRVEIDADDNKKLRVINHLLDLPKRPSKFQIQFL